MNSTILKTYHTMNLPMNPPPLVRQVNVGAGRNRIGTEQYSRVLSESGDILLIDYTRVCLAVLTLKKGTLYPHAFYNPIYYGDEIGLQLQVVDLATGDILPDWEYKSSGGYGSSLTLKPGCVYEGAVEIISPVIGDIGVPMDIDMY
jgi:hypothetical protein